MTNIHPISDVHIEFTPRNFRLAHPNDVDIVVDAGDTAPGVQGLMWLRENYPNSEIVVIGGNHAYYGKRAVARHNQKMKKKAVELGIHFLQNEIIVLHDIQFIGATLWTDYKLFGNQPLAMMDAQREMNDFSQIKIVMNRPITPEFILAEHYKSREFIFDELKKPFDGKRYVITHHAPTGKSVPDRFLHDKVTPAYASDLANMICYHGPTIWHHGHIHSSSDYEVCDTRVICNPHGYYGVAVNKNFDPELLITL